MRSFHHPGRSLTYGSNGMVATSHPTASVVGLDILRAGGNAVDAAIAIASTLGVVEPAMTGVGGDCFALVWKPAGMSKAGAVTAEAGKGGGSSAGSNSGQLIAMNASGRAPNAATTDWYASKGISTIELQSPHAVTVPGCVDGWSMLLRDHGTMTFERVLAPAIELAEKGFVVAPRVAYDWAKFDAKLNVHSGARQHLLKDGRVPRERETMAFPALAKTLRAIAKDGRDGFYQGAVADDLVTTLSALGGLHTMADFAAQKATYVDPISITYGGLDVFELPPSNQGITALIMLNLLKRIPAYRDTQAVSATRYHILMEAARLAFAVRDVYVADPDAARVPVDAMLSDGFADELAKRIDPKRMTPDLGPVPKAGGTDTVYFSVADKNGMMVAFINSLFSAFGTAIVGPKSGVALHNRGQGFRLDAKHPSAIAPGKRPMHTLVPAFAMRDGKPDMAFGVMGANFQPMGHVYVVTNIVDHGLDAQEALDCPRMFYENGELGVEPSVPGPVLEDLARLGHKPIMKADPWGGGQIVQRDHDRGIYVGASDPRKDGCALGY